MNSPVDSRAGKLTLRIQENLLSTNAAGFREKISRELDAASAARPAVVEVDLCGAKIVDSVGLNLIVMVIKKVTAWEGKVRLLVDDANVCRTFRFTRLDTHAEIVMR
jgi:anti-anti-sigma factor